jgi:hypothetical protein
LPRYDADFHSAHPAGSFINRANEAEVRRTSGDFRKWILLRL